jgi:hypothetical protein
MRDAGRILVTVALLLVGILVYDGLRASPSTPDAWDVPERSQTRASLDAPREGGDGAGEADAFARVAALADRIRALEERLPAPPSAGGEAGAGPGSASPAARAAFDAAHLPAFRAVYEVVERERRDEGMRTSIRSELERLGVRLSPSEEATVLEETIRLWDERTEVWRSAQPRRLDEAARRDAVARVRALEDSWAAVVRSTLRPEDAEKVVSAFVRAAGMPFGPQEPSLNR